MPWVWPLVFAPHASACNTLHSPRHPLTDAAIFLWSTLVPPFMPTVLSFFFLVSCTVLEFSLLGSPLIRCSLGFPPAATGERSHSPWCFFLQSFTRVLRVSLPLLFLFLFLSSPFVVIWELWGSLSPCSALEHRV